jgi:hydroxymethylpyrimidine pyrophosphatase-like HAD family hydrolase
MEVDSMRFSVLALAYDGTIADQGVLDPEVRQAIRAARAHGVTVVNVTGRSLDDLRQVLGDLRLVDAVVAENATRQARLKAGATQERTLEGVACTRLFGVAITRRLTPRAPHDVLSS